MEVRWWYIFPLLVRSTRNHTYVSNLNKKTQGRSIDIVGLGEKKKMDPQIINMIKIKSKIDTLIKFTITIKTHKYGHNFTKTTKLKKKKTSLSIFN